MFPGVCLGLGEVALVAEADAMFSRVHEDEPTRLRKELVALAGMTLAWIDALEIP